MASAEGPPELIVNHLLRFEQAQQRIEAAVDIADRQDLFRGGENGLRWKWISRLKREGLRRYTRQGQGEASKCFLDLQPPSANPEDLSVGPIPEHMGSVIDIKDSEDSNLRTGRGHGQRQGQQPGSKNPEKGPQGPHRSAEGQGRDHPGPRENFIMPWPIHNPGRSRLGPRIASILRS